MDGQKPEGSNRRIKKEGGEKGEGERKYGEGQLIVRTI